LGGGDWYLLGLLNAKAVPCGDCGLAPISASKTIIECHHSTDPRLLHMLFTICIKSAVNISQRTMLFKKHKYTQCSYSTWSLTLYKRKSMPVLQLYKEPSTVPRWQGQKKFIFTLRCQKILQNIYLSESDKNAHG
jgi:hypothetical protein